MIGVVLGAIGCPGSSDPEPFDADVTDDAVGAVDTPSDGPVAADVAPDESVSGDPGPGIPPQVTDVQIAYRCTYLAGGPRLDCHLGGDGAGAWVTDECRFCETSPGQPACDPPESLDGAAVEAGLVTALVDAMSGLREVPAKVQCFDHTDDFPTYAVEVRFANADPAVISIGGNCGPMFVTQGQAIACDCSRKLYDAVWAILGPIAPDLWRPYDHGPDEHCSCDADYNG
jgi:hypothetical protein